MQRTDHLHMNGDRKSGFIAKAAVIFFAGLLPAHAAMDSAYIRPDSTLIVKASVYTSLTTLSVQENKAAGETDYLPNSPASIGIGVVHPKIPFEIAFGMDAGAKEDDHYLRTRALDLQINHYGRMYVLDASLEHYHGFYIDDDTLAYDSADCPDLKIIAASLGAQYIFNGRKFSYQAAFSQSERQLRSAGSLLIGGNLQYLRIDSDSSFNFKGKHSITSLQLGLNAGYSWNWVITPRWLLNGSLTIGGNLEKTDAESGLHVDPAFLVRAACLYSREKWFTGMYFVLNTLSSLYRDDSGINFSYGRIYIIYARRFSL